MAELDDQLGSALDDHITVGEDECSAKADTASGCNNRGGIPLNSHHVKVHAAEPLELDMHAMEHMLQSFCAEHQLQPGPASLLLGELGLGGSTAEKKSRGGGRGYAGNHCTVTASSALDGMD